MRDSRAKINTLQVVQGLAAALLLPWTDLRCLQLCPRIHLCGYHVLYRNQWPMCINEVSLSLSTEVANGILAYTWCPFSSLVGPGHRKGSSTHLDGSFGPGSEGGQAFCV